MLLLVASVGTPDASAKGKKVHACVVKNGPDKGVMRYSRTGKCQKGEKKLSWGKKGKRGKQGPAGPKGETGPQGSSGVTDELLATIAAQQATIDQLKTQLSGLTSQLNGLAPQVAALCSQMPTVVSQVNTLGTVISGMGLPVGVISFVTPVPAALGAFACP